MIPFVREQRKNEVNYKWKEGLPISNELRCTYKIDSSLTYLKYWNREDIQVISWPTGVLSIIDILSISTSL